MRNAILTIGLIVSSFSSALASENIVNEKDHKQISLVTFNIDTNIFRTEEGYARDSHPEWRVGARMPMILKSLDNLIQKQKPDLIHIQEGRKFNTKFGDEVNSIDPLLDFLYAQGYRAESRKYNPSNLAFSYISAVRADKFVVDGHYSLYFSLTPEEPTDHTDHAARLGKIKEHNYGEEWERSAFVTAFHDHQGRRFYSFNVHLGFSFTHRLKASELLNEWAKDILSLCPAAYIIDAGDFNCFPDAGGADQLNIIKAGGVLQHASQKLKLLTEGADIESSCFAFPYDFGADDKRLNMTQSLIAMDSKTRKAKIAEVFKKECKAVGSHLDHVFSHGFASALSFLSPTPLFGTPAGGYTEESVKSYILDHHKEGPAFASDHQPVVSILKFE